MTLHCPEDGRYSFYNSPYPAHHLMTGIDIYPDTTHSIVAPSPISGEILQIRRVKAPRGHDFEAPEHDTVTIIRSTQAPERVVKLLHVDTHAEVGETIHVGQTIGTMIRSGYFGYQTPLHAHVEVRPPDDPLRVRGAYPMGSLLDLEKLGVTEELMGTATSTRKGYAQIKLRQKNPWVVADIGGSPGIIDGGIPLYGWFGAHVKAPRMGAPVKLLGKRIGNVTKTGSRSCVADCVEFDARIDATPVDLFFILTPKQGTILVATSKKRGELDLGENEEVSITVS
ncbi:MAG: hypothetical protein NTV61_07640 [Candidatus Bathyarchaeota archaeon]|nr:hypothetical protein [Candidatus Bathyarchaeota archaeon]